MAIKTYDKNGEKLFEVYLNSFNEQGKRTQVRRRGYLSLREAKAEEFQLKCDLHNKRNDIAPRTWSQWHQECVEKIQVELRPSTAMSYDLSLKKWIHPVWRDRELQTITPSDVHDLIYNSIPDVSMNTRRTILKMVKRIFQMAVEDSALDKNPALKVKVKVPEAKQAVLNATEVDLFLKEAKATGHRFYEIWAVALLTGMRSGELYALRWTDVDFGSRRVTVSRSWCSKNGFGTTKSARTRVVPISMELERLLKEMKLRAKPDCEFVLPHLSEWTVGEQAKVTREFCQSIGVTSVKFHDLRATFITQLLLKGVSLAQVMAVVGHSQIKTTNVYLRVLGCDLDGVTDKLGVTLPQDRLAQVIDLRG